MEGKNIKRKYVKPKLKVIELVVEEVLSGSCRNMDSGFAAGGKICMGSGCFNPGNY